MDIQTLNDTASDLLQRSSSLTTIPSPNAAPPDPVPAETLAAEKKQREESTTFTDYAAAAFRQDSVIPGLISYWHGHDFIPQEGYSAFSSPESWKQLTEGVFPEFHNEFLSAVSPTHAEYLRERILQKQRDLINLSDMGWAGNVARLAGSFLLPDQLALAVASGGISKVAQAARLARAAGTAAEVSRMGAVATGIAADAAMNGGIEKLRQSVNFEHDNAQVLEASLIGGVLSFPFAIAGANKAARVATAATKERAGLEIFRSEREGAKLTPEDHATLAEISRAAEVAAKVENGQLPPEAMDHIWADDPPAMHQEYPGGFLGGSAGAAQVEHIGTPETTFNGYIPVLDRLGIKIPYRFDLYAQLNRSENPVIQKFAQRFIKDPIGSKEGFTQGRTASEEKKLIQRVWEGRTGVEAKDAFNRVREIRKMGPLEAHRFNRNFYEMVTAVKSGDTAVLQENADIAAELQKAANAYHQMYADIAQKAKAAQVKGAEDLAPDDFYVNRVWLPDRIKEAMRTHGEDRIASLVAHSFKSPDLYGDVAKAKSFLRVILKTEFSHHLQDLHLASRDLESLRAELGAVDPITGQPKLSQQDIDAIVDVMFAKNEAAAGDAGRASNLKFRMSLDEAYGERMENGSVLKVSDLMERDARVLASKYLNSMAGHIAMAKRGIRSRAEFESVVVKAALDHHMEHGILNPDGGQFNKDLQWLRDIYDNITGRPMSTQVFNNTSRISAMLRSWSRSTFLGELGLTAAAEMKQAVAMTSLRALILQSGTFADLISSLRSGRMVDSKLAREAEELWGLGREHAASYLRQNEITDFTYDRTLSKLENAANAAAHAVDVISGNSTVTAATKLRSAMMFIQHHYDIAAGREKLTASKIKRLAHQGIEADEVHDVLGHLKQYTTVDKTNGRVESVDWERWHSDHPSTYDQYHLAVERETRDAIQDHDLGETIPWGHTQLGKIFMELRTFMAVAHAKNFLKNASYMDRTTFNVWMYSLVGEALMYAVQTNLNFAHNKEELDKRLTLDRIAKAAVQRASVFGMLPAALDTAGWMVTGGHAPLSSGGQANTANTDNRNLLTPPSAVMLSKAYNTTKTLAGAVNPWSSTVTTRNEFKDAFSLLPGSNTYGLRNLQDYLSSTFPKHELQQIAP